MKYRNENNHKTEYKNGDVIILGYDNSREAQAFYCEFSKNITLENVCIYRNGGMGFVADVCENIILDKYRVEKKAGRHEYFTTTADSIFSTNCSGYFVLKDSYISDTYDDAINVHGYYTEIGEIISADKVKLSHLHPAHSGLMPYFAGDKVHISDPDTFNEECVLEIADVTFDENRDNIVLTFKEEADIKVGMLVENPDRTPNLLIENTTVKRAPHMRLSAKNVTVRNNNLSLEYCDIYVDDLIDFWGESGAVRKIEIVGNKFGNTAKTNISVSSCRKSTSNHLHENVIIKNNIFKNKQETAIKISDVNTLEMSDNVFEAEFED